MKEKQIIEIPQHFHNETLLFNEWFSKVVTDFFHVSGKENYVREYEIISYRFGLDGRSVLTLEEIGIIFDVTRERIRQIEEQALENLKQVVNEGINHKRNISLKKEMFMILREYKNSFSKFNKIASEIAIMNHTTAFFSEVNIDISLLRLLFTLFGLTSLKLDTGLPDYSFAWAFEDINTKKIESALQAILNYLREVAIAKSLNDIKLAINKHKNIKSRFNDQELTLAIDLSQGIEKLEDGKLQLRYDWLRSIPDKAYRVLYYADKPINVRQFALILNRENFKYGERSRITAHHIGARLSSDPRFDSIGRSGEWILSEWKNYSTEYILELMEDALHSAGEPLSANTIFDYVITRRPVEKKAITSYLRQDSRFVRVGTDLFALRDWGIASVSTSRERSPERVFSKAKLCEYIELIFQSHSTKELFLSDLAQEISALEPTVSFVYIYHAIPKMPAVKIIDSPGKNRKRKLAIFEPNYRSKLSKLEILSKDMPIGDLIQSTVRRILENRPDNQLELVSIRDLVAQELHCPPASVYSSIDKMDDIEKLKNKSNQLCCRLKKPKSQYENLVNKIDDKKLASEINRALSLVNIDSIDLALFQLGKIFEFTLKRYMQEVQAKGLLPVTSDDLSKLFKMVQWAGKTGVITDETSLQYLRIERNDRGHGIPPEQDERQALLNNSSTLIPFYLDYIILLEQRRAKLH